MVTKQEWRKRIITEILSQGLMRHKDLWNKVEKIRTLSSGEPIPYRARLKNKNDLSSALKELVEEDQAVKRIQKSRKYVCYMLTEDFKEYVKSQQMVQESKKNSAEILKMIQAEIIPPARSEAFLRVLIFEALEGYLKSIESVCLAPDSWRFHVRGLLNYSTDQFITLLFESGQMYPKSTNKAMTYIVKMLHGQVLEQMYLHNE